jgi:hypothetical protein
MAQTPVLPPERHIPFKKGGWGAAILTTAAAVGAFLTAFWIHTQTYRHPRDVMMKQRGSVDAHAAATSEHGGEHAPAAPATPGAPAPAPAAHGTGGH